MNAKWQRKNLSSCPKLLDHYTTAEVSRRFRIAFTDAGVQGLTFHDLRHEATCRLFDCLASTFGATGRACLLSVVCTNLRFQTGFRLACCIGRRTLKRPI